MTDILVVIDPTAENHPCLERAIWLGKLYQATLHLFICDYDPYLAGNRFSDSPGLRKARESLLAAHRKTLKTLGVKAQDEGLSVAIDAGWDRPLDEGIARKADRLKPLMVVKDTHYHSVLKRTVFSNTDWNLIQGCPAPLLLVKPNDLNSPPRVMAAVDPLHEHDKPAKLDQKLIGFAQDLAERASGELIVLHCFDPTPAIAGAATTLATPIAVPVREVTEALEEQHRDALNELARKAGIAGSAIRMQQGAASDVLPEFAAEEQIDIAVMGAVSRSGLRRVFIGHTAEHVLDKLPCDLLIVKP